MILKELLSVIELTTNAPNASEKKVLFIFNSVSNSSLLKIRNSIGIEIVDLDNRDKQFQKEMKELEMKQKENEKKIRVRI